MDSYYLIVFNNTQGALKAESFLKSKHIELVIMPTPTHITHSCGISIKLAEKEFTNVKEYLNVGDVEYKYVFKREDNGFKEVIF
jgi:hypothetical protein